MKRALLVTSIIAGLATVVAASCAFGAATTSGRSGASVGGPPCTPTVTRIQGHPAAVACGPATATLRVGGKTYTFRHGFCQQSRSAGVALQLDLGTTVVGVKGNAGRPDFAMLISKNHTAASVFHADYGGRRILGDSLIDVRGSIPARGAFTSRVAVGGTFTGSWDCHGVVWTKP